jgi:energy-coupling factor transport system ATP-binding protein
MQGDCAAVFEKGAELEKIGLSAPQISKVAASLREKGFPLPRGLYTVEAVTAAILEML